VKLRVDRGQLQTLVSGTLQLGRKLRSWLSLSLIFVFGIVGSPHSALAQYAPEVLVRVINYAQVPSGSIRAAEREAARIFSAAGLLTQWVNCSGKGSSTNTLNVCSQPLEPREIVVRLIAESTSEPFQNSVFGFAVVPLVASVYVSYAVRSAKRDNAEFEMPVILGSVIAHEIGHLMLGLNSHSDTGIMQKRWERKQLQLVTTGNLLFTSEQGKLMQAETQKRSGVPTVVSQNEIDTSRRPVGELPFQLVAGYLIQVEGQIGTQNHLRFLLDTGASKSIVDSRIADGLKLNYQATQSFNFDRTLSWRQAAFPEVRFGPIRADKTVMLVGDLANYAEFTRSVDAIIGMDLLKLSNFTIDFDTRKVVFHSFNQDIPAGTGDPLSNCLLLEIRVQDHPIQLVLDTGFQGILLFEERLIKTVPGLEVPEKQRKVIVGDRLHAKQTKLRDIAIGSSSQDVTILLAKSPAADVLPGIVGVAGISALNAHRVNFNIAERTISWE
jgi:predicted aspartyl protease